MISSCCSSCIVCAVSLRKSRRFSRTKNVNVGNLTSLHSCVGEFFRVRRSDLLSLAIVCFINSLSCRLSVSRYISWELALKHHDGVVCGVEYCEGYEGHHIRLLIGVRTINTSLLYRWTKAESAAHTLVCQPNQLYYHTRL